MSKTSKFKLSNILVWVLMAMLVFGLAGFGVTNFGGNVRSIGSVGQTVIDANTYARSVEQQLNALREQAGPDLTFAQAEQMGLPQAVLQQRIGQAAMEEAARLAQLSVNDDEVARRIQQIPALQGPGGQFSREAYEFQIERSGMTIDTFEETVRREASGSILRAALLAGMIPPATYAETLYHYIGEERAVTYAALEASMLDTQPAAPSEDDVAAYYDANPALFTLPATRAITYAWLSPEMMLDQVTLPQDVLRDAYEDRAALYNRPERRMVSRLGFADMAQADAAKARLDAGDVTFDDLLAERGLTEADVDLGAVAQSDLSSDAGPVVFGLDDTGVTAPAQSAVGPALFRVNAILSASFTPFEDAVEEIRTDLALIEAARLVTDEIEALDDLLAAGLTLEELADETQMMLGRVDWSAEIPAEAAPATLLAFAEAASALSTNDFPEILQAEDGSLLALRLDAETPARLQPLADVHPAAQAGAIAAKLTEALERYGDTLADAFGAQETDDLGLTLIDRQGLTRQRPAFDVPFALQDALFDMEAGAVQVISDDTGTYLLRLDRVTRPNIDTPEAQAALAQLSRQTAETVLSEIVGQFATAVANDEGVQLDQTALTAVYGLFR